MCASHLDSDMLARRWTWDPCPHSSVRVTICCERIIRRAEPSAPSVYRWPTTYRVTTRRARRRVGVAWQCARAPRWQAPRSLSDARPSSPIRLLLAEAPGEAVRLVGTVELTEAAVLAQAVVLAETAASRELVPAGAVPAEAVPAEAVPAEAVPAEAVPAEAAEPRPRLSCPRRRRSAV